MSLWPHMPIDLKGYICSFLTYQHDCPYRGLRVRDIYVRDQNGYPRLLYMHFILDPVTLVFTPPPNKSGVSVSIETDYENCIIGQEMHKREKIQCPPYMMMITPPRSLMRYLNKTRRSSSKTMHPLKRSKMSRIMMRKQHRKSIQCALRRTCLSFTSRYQHVYDRVFHTLRSLPNVHYEMDYVFAYGIFGHDAPLCILPTCQRLGLFEIITIHPTEMDVSNVEKLTLRDDFGAVAQLQDVLFGLCMITDWYLYDTISDDHDTIPSHTWITPQRVWPSLRTLTITYSPQLPLIVRYCAPQLRHLHLMTVPITTSQSWFCAHALAQCNHLVRVTLYVNDATALGHVMNMMRWYSGALLGNSRRHVQFVMYSGCVIEYPLEPFSNDPIHAYCYMDQHFARMKQSLLDDNDMDV